MAWKWRWTKIQYDKFQKLMILMRRDTENTDIMGAFSVDSLFILIPIALVFVYIAVRVFMWSVKSGQYDDLDTEGRRILFEEKKQAKKSSVKPVTKNDV